MSEFEGRRELGEAAHQAIDRVAGDIDRLVTQLAEPVRDAAAGTRAIADFLEERGFEIERGIGGSPDAFRVEARNWNEDDMRKGLRHGHVAFVTHLGPRLHGAESAGPHLAAGAAVGATLGLAASLAGIHGIVSLVCVQNEDDLRALAERGEFESPDSALTAYPSATGSGFQHTINRTGEQLAGLTITVRYPDGLQGNLRELHAAIGSIIDDLEAPDALTPTANGFELRARRAETIERIAGRITALARTRAESSGSDVNIERGQEYVVMQPSRILARRIKTFGDTLDMRQDRVAREPAGPPTAWGAVSHVTPTAIARFPIEPGDEEAARLQMRFMSKALASTGLDILGDMEFRGYAEGEFIRGLRERGIRREPRRWLGVHPVLPPKEPRTRPANLPDVIVRGPGVPGPTPDDLTRDDEN